MGWCSNQHVFPSHAQCSWDGLQIPHNPDQDVYECNSGVDYLFGNALVCCMSCVGITVHVTKHMSLMMLGFCIITNMLVMLFSKLRKCD